MQPVLTVAEMAAVDEAAQVEVTLEALIARAGAALASAAVEMLGDPGPYGRRVVVIAGRGNNGNDGRVVARLLARRGARVRMVDASEVPASLAAEAPELVVDAAYGTGFRGEYRGPETGGAAVLAVDVPTGLNADLGVAGEGAVVADRTVTFGSMKPGLLLNDGPTHCGRVTVRPIGLPVERGVPSIRLVEDSDVAALLPERRHSDHKWSTALMIVAGSPGMYGAPTFVARGAARAGAGMVRLGVPGADPAALPAGEAVASVLPEKGYDEAVAGELERCKALVVGPGLGRSEATATAVRRLVGSAPVPVLVDADGLFALGTAEEAAEVLKGRSAPALLTPHEGEFARLAGAPPGDDRIAAARSLASRVGAYVLLKGSTTVVAGPDGTCVLAASGSSRLATAGTGDVLSGVIGGFLARGVPALEAAALGAHVHGLAAMRGRPIGLVASDLPDLVSDVLSSMEATGSG